jgi:hypothetical protein
MELGTGTRLRPGGLQSPDVDGLSSVHWAVLDGMGLGTALSADGASVDVQDGASDGTLSWWEVYTASDSPLFLKIDKCIIKYI